MRRRIYSEDERQEIVAAHEQSNIGSAEFAKQRGISTSALIRWKQRYGSKRTGKGRAVSMVEVTSVTGEPFEVHLALGRRVVVPGNFSEGALRRLLKTVESA